MTDLIPRLSKLDAPDREVDAQIYILFNIPAERAGRIDYAHGMVGWWPKDGPYISAVTVPAYTASVDAVIALAERVLPGWRVENLCEWEDETLRSRGPWTCDLRKNGEDFFSTLKGKCHHAPSPAIALLIALLRAKEASKL